MNPFASHWLRLSVWLLLASPIVAFAVMLSTGVEFAPAIMFTLYMWALVCVILALIALAALCGRLFRRGLRALRR